MEDYRFPKDQIARTKRASKRKQTLRTYCIEGEYVTAEQIAQRCGRNLRRIRERLRVLATKEGPITWDKLKGVNKA